MYPMKPASNNADGDDDAGQRDRTVAAVVGELNDLNHAPFWHEPKIILHNERLQLVTELYHGILNRQWEPYHNLIIISNSAAPQRKEGGQMICCFKLNHLPRVREGVQEADS